MRVNEYRVLQMAVEDGVVSAWNRAFKHSETRPSDEHKRMWEDAAVKTVLNEICEWFSFEPEGES